MSKTDCETNVDLSSIYFCDYIFLFGGFVCFDLSFTVLTLEDLFYLKAHKFIILCESMKVGSLSGADTVQLKCDFGIRLNSFLG